MIILHDFKVAGPEGVQTGRFRHKGAAMSYGRSHPTRM